MDSNPHRIYLQILYELKNHEPCDQNITEEYYHSIPCLLITSFEKFFFKYSLATSKKEGK